MRPAIPLQHRYDQQLRNEAAAAHPRRITEAEEEIEAWEESRRERLAADAETGRDLCAELALHAVHAVHAVLTRPTPAGPGRSAGPRWSEAQSCETGSVTW
ncbi:hypothetical protein WKI68_42250 [Streptomyces sp. MS1.HAVA.3]|uniref:Uncharacterized protein n=1 Tax=Streptomyces caledonius TaxID=3134107 RepID=A0ABU8UDT8_9ACTN